MDNELDNTSENKPLRDEKGRLLPGYTANPKGKPKGSLSLLAILKRELQKIPEGEDINYAEAIVNLYLREVFKKKTDESGNKIPNPNVAVVESIIDRIDGRAKQSIDMDVTDKREVEEMRDKLNEFLGSYGETGNADRKDGVDSGIIQEEQSAS